MWLKSHKWNLIPHTLYEIRREMRVRESRHTVMLFDKKYYDIDNGKFDTNKMQTIPSHSLAELCTDDYIGLNVDSEYLCRYRNEESKWFIPNDNNFDEECRLEEEIKKKEIEESNKKYHEELLLKQQMESAQLREKYAQYEREQQRLKEELLLREATQDIEKKKIELIKYEQQVKEAQLRGTWNGRRRVDSIKNLPNMTNIRPNFWKPK